MPELMIFKEVIEQQGVPFIAHLGTEGGYVDGEWVPGGANDEERNGVLLPLTSGQRIGETLTYAENGVYSLKDKKLLTAEPLPNGTKITFKGDTYTIQDFKDLSDYTDVNIYIARWREK